MQSPREQTSDPNSLEPEELQSIGGEISRCFPQRRLDTELVLMEISPHRLHAYWHITPEDLSAARERLDKGRVVLVLRFYDLTDNPSPAGPAPTFDIEIEGVSGRQYVELWEAAKSYEAELGLRRDDDLLIPLARSNRIELPRAGYGHPHGAGVVTLTPDAEALYCRDEARQRPQPPQAQTTDPETPWDLTLDSRPSRLPPQFPNPLEGALPTYPERVARPSDGTSGERGAPAAAAAQQDGLKEGAALETRLPESGRSTPASIDTPPFDSVGSAYPPYPLHQAVAGTAGWADAIVAAIAIGRCHPASPRQTGQPEALASSPDSSSFILGSSSEIQPRRAVGDVVLPPLPVANRKG